MKKIPRYDQLMNAAIDGLRQLGGSGSVAEIYEKIVEHLRLPEDVLTVLHDPESDNRTEVQYQLGTLTYLKKFGVLENSRRGVWALAKKAESFQQVDPKEVKRFFHDEVRKRRKTQPNQESSDETEEEGSEITQLWRPVTELIENVSVNEGWFKEL